MKHCNHSQWLGLCAEDAETILFETDRLSTLVRQFSTPDSQYPSLLLFIGNTAKSQAIREFIPVKNKILNSRRNHGEIHLHVEPCGAFSDRPVLIADGDLPSRNTSGKLLAASRCHEITRRILPRARNGVPRTDLSEFADNLYSRLLCPFADVICFFATDVGGIRSIVRRLASWVEKGQSSTLPSCVSPRVLIVTESDRCGAAYEAEVRDVFKQVMREEKTEDLFSGFEISFISLFPRDSMSASARHRRLKERLMKESDRVRSRRIQSRTLFSAQHMSDFFRYACIRFASTFKEPLDFVRASRLQNPVSVDLKEHLSNFLGNLNPAEELIEFAGPMIASSFLLDAYPPDMHVFHPDAVFQALYQDVCHQVGQTGILVYEESPDMISPPNLDEIVADQLNMLFERLIKGDRMTSAGIHRDTLQRFRDRWGEIRSNVTCFVCLARKPEYRLPCGHSMCENCVRIFGADSADDPHAFEVQECFLCGSGVPLVMVKIKPPTAGVRVLSIDGGGIRGVVPLEFLRLLQDRIGLSYPVQDNFDIAFGTSSGGLIILAMFVNGWSVDDCANAFEGLSRRAFKSRTYATCIPFLSYLVKFLVSYFTDGLYAADDLEDVLREVFGDRSILDCSYATSTGAKVGLPATTIREPDHCIFTNYNGAGSRPQDCGYHVMQPKDGFAEVLVWEAARSGSAAPWFFTPMRIPGVGTFQDGGLWRNNPVDVALGEMKVIWPLVQYPDIVVNLGTGSASSGTQNPSNLGSRGVWLDGFIRRCLRALENFMNAKRLWIELLNRTEPDMKERYFRLDVKFDGREPGLDDTTMMPELKAKVRAEISGSTDLDNLARRIVAAQFYFELESTPRYIGGKYSCTGYILCRLRSGNPALRELLDQLSGSSAKFMLRGRPIAGHMCDRSFVSGDGNFRKKVEFQVRDRVSKLSICLQEGSQRPRSISGSPFSIDAMVIAQGLDAHFGRADHAKRKGFGGVEPPCKRCKWL